MKAHIRNRSFQARQMVATVSAGKALGILDKDTASDALFDAKRKQDLAAQRRKESPPVFRRQKLTTGTFVFLPCNPNAQAMLDSMTKEQRIAFLLSANDPIRIPSNAESKRIESCRAIKAVPRGTRESEVFHPLASERERETNLYFTAQLAGCTKKEQLPTALDHSIPRRSGAKLPSARVSDKTRELIEFIQGHCKRITAKESNPAHHECYNPCKTHV